MTQENIDEKRCSKCSHHNCCKRSLVDAFLGKLFYGIEPLRDIGDSTYCNYMSEKGCIIEWKKRPKQCKIFKCKEWIAEEKGDISIEEAIRRHQEEILKAAKEDAADTKKIWEEWQSGLMRTIGDREMGESSFGDSNSSSSAKFKWKRVLNGKGPVC